MGKNFFKVKIIANKDLLRATKGFALNVAGKPNGPDKVTLIKKDGSEIVVEFITQPIVLVGKKLVLGIVREIVDKK